MIELASPLSCSVPAVVMFNGDPETQVRCRSCFRRTAGALGRLLPWPTTSIGHRHCSMSGSTNINASASILKEHNGGSPARLLSALVNLIGGVFGGAGAGAAAAMGTTYALAYGAGFLIFGPLSSAKESVSMPDSTGKRLGRVRAEPIGGCGRCTGFGWIGTSSRCRNRPLKVTRGWSDHTAFISCSPSVNRATKVSRSTPNAVKLRNPPPGEIPSSTRRCKPIFGVRAIRIPILVYVANDRPRAFRGRVSGHSAPQLEHLRSAGSQPARAESR
jgi:hypothetical protein